MDWEKVKNIMIVMLLLTNMFLLGFAYLNSPGYTMSGEQYDAIMTVLQKSGVTLDAPLLKVSPPMPALELYAGALNPGDICGAFLKDGFTDAGDGVYMSGGAEVMVTGGGFVYNNPNGSGAGNSCDGIMKSLSAELPGFVLDKSDTSLSGNPVDNTVTYRQVYRGYMIYSNYVVFTVSNSGIIRAECSYNPPAFFDKARGGICSPDVAAFAFLRRAKALYNGDKINISKMDLLYCVPQPAAGADNQDQAPGLTAVPYYRFGVSGKADNVLVNAYTCAVQ